MISSALNIWASPSSRLSFPLGSYSLIIISSQLIFSSFFVWYVYVWQTIDFLCISNFCINSWSSIFMVFDVFMLILLTWVLVHGLWIMRYRHRVIHPSSTFYSFYILFISAKLIFSITNFIIVYSPGPYNRLLSLILERN